MNARIDSLQHALVKHIVKLRKEPLYRQQQRKMALEGKKLIDEGRRFVNKLFFTASCRDIASSFSCDKWEVSSFVMDKMSGTLSPEGMIAEADLPPFAALGLEKRWLVLDRISDPGNMGTLLRTALAFGWTSIFLLPGSCDPYNEKVLRAAKGAHFHLKLAQGGAEMLERWVKETGAQSLVADTQGFLPQNIAMQERRVLILGNEACGPSQELLSFSQKISLPMGAESESLNVAVAGGILLYLLNLQE